MIATAGWYFKVVLLVLMINPDGSYKGHEVHEVERTIYECEEDKPETVYKKDGSEIHFACAIITGA
jgi:hypothetical protein